MVEQTEHSKSSEAEKVTVVITTADVLPDFYSSSANRQSIQRHNAASLHDIPCNLTIVDDEPNGRRQPHESKSVQEISAKDKESNSILKQSLGTAHAGNADGEYSVFRDDMVGNLFSNIGQLEGKWLSELYQERRPDMINFCRQLRHNGQAIQREYENFIHDVEKP